MRYPYRCGVPGTGTRYVPPVLHRGRSYVRRASRLCKARERGVAGGRVCPSTVHGYQVLVRVIASLERQPSHHIIALFSSLLFCKRQTSNNTTPHITSHHIYHRTSTNTVPVPPCAPQLIALSSEFLIKKFGVGFSAFFCFHT